MNIIHKNNEQMREHKSHVFTSLKTDGSFHAWFQVWGFRGCPLGRGLSKVAAISDLIRRAKMDEPELVVTTDHIYSDDDWKD